MTPTADSGARTPDLIDLVRELRETVGLPAGALPITPKQAWEEALAEVSRLRTFASSGMCWRCEERYRWSSPNDGSGV